VLAVAGPPIVVMLLGALAVIGLRRSATRADLVARTQRVALSLSTLLQRLTDAETGQRGYLLTLDADYLGPYHGAEADVNRALDSLRSLTADEPGEGARIDSLEAVAHEKFAELDETITVAQSRGTAAAIALLRAGRGQLMMDSARMIAAAIDRDASRRLADRVAASARDRTLTDWVAIIGTLLAALFALGGNRLLDHFGQLEASARRDLEARNEGMRQLGAELEAHNARLQEQAAELETQSEELQSQAAELEASNEELQAANDELARTTQSLDAHAREARESRERLRRVLESAPDAVSVFDSQWRYTYTNPAGSALLRAVGRDPEQVLGRTLWDALPGVAGTPFETEVRRAMASRQVVVFEERYAPLDAWLETRAVPTDEGGVVTFIRDITARRRADAERDDLLARERAARAEADAANRAKADFLTTMSHELRTPLNAIAGYTQLIADGIRGPVSAEQAEDLARIARAGRHLLGLINDILNFARLESGEIQFARERVLVAEMVVSAASMIEPQMRSKGITFTRGDLPPGLAATGDRDKMLQIVLNLLSNAAKFTRSGGTVTVSAQARDGAVHLAVRDTGRGIPAGRVQAIFEPFVQVGRQLGGEEQGVGLGLAISRELARGMGGDITVESREGAGSVFTLVLPLHPAST